MDAKRLAGTMLETAVAEQQAAHRIAPGDDVPAVRAEVRRLARERGVRIRTGIVGDALVVVRADAEVWHESTATMRRKLTP
ncbi:hypothetical protein ACRAWB_10955 [Leifsonia poae]|uniref:hypothetical protein n=1 Tax=Leifsonia poae TaxID=110933 RepID=UPI003D69E216